MIRRRTCQRTVGAILLAALIQVPALAETYEIDPVHSSVGFTIRHLVSRSTGTFTDFSGSITYDPKQPAKSSFECVIQAASINTGNERRDGHLKGADFFDVENFAEITFKSTAVKSAGENELSVTGDFTLHGVTKSVTLPVTVLGVGTHPRHGRGVAGLAAEFTIMRSDYGVDNWTDVAGVLGNEVKISLLIEAGVKAP